MKRTATKPQALSSVPAGTVVTVYHTDKLLSMRPSHEGRYRVSRSVEHSSLVGLWPVVWMDGAWRDSSIRQPFFRDGSTLVVIDR